MVHPQYHGTLEDVHSSFLSSGSNIITTNSYGVVPGVGFEESQISKYMDIAGQIARRAVQKHTSTEPCFVLGSLGPLVESYRADLIKPHDEGVLCYQRACDALYRHIDAYIGETLSCVEESLQVLDAVAEFSPGGDKERRPLLISYTLDSIGNFRDGQAITDGIRQFLDQAAKKSNVKCKWSKRTF